jgi:5-methylthioadenosine/S-adenosylhomocysteine deaminase
MDTPSVDTRISASLIFTAAGPELAGGCVEITGGRISHVGPAATGAPAAETVDASGMIVIPGLVNTHCHTSQQLARGLADDVDLLTWLRQRIWPYEAALSDSDVAISTWACAIEQIRNGVTAIAEPGGQHPDATARVLEAAGIRALLGRSTMDEGEGVPARLTESTQACLDAGDQLARRWHGAADGRLRASYTLRTIFNCSDELILATAERASRFGTVVQMHVAEVPEETDYAKATRGLTTLRHLSKLGILGPRFLSIHSVWLDDQELDLLAETETPVSHNAASAMRVLGQPRIADMLDRGIVVGLGTDGAPTNNRMSMVDEIYLASLLQKSLRRDPTALPARRVLEMATIAGARALSWDDEIGSIEAGKKADLVVINPATVNMTPVHDAVSALVTSMKTENIDSVMCDGRWLLRNRELTMIDEAALLTEAQARATTLAPSPRPWTPFR